jgi:sugar lactone lactonase YvrE
MISSATDVTSTETVGKKPGLPDGMKVDVKGNLFATGPGGVYVFRTPPSSAFSTPAFPPRIATSATTAVHRRERQFGQDSDHHEGAVITEAVRRTAQVVAC